jgi:hypothetical protein
MPEIFERDANAPAETLSEGSHIDVIAPGQRLGRFVRQQLHLRQVDHRFPMTGTETTTRSDAAT